MQKQNRKQEKENSLKMLIFGQTFDQIWTDLTSSDWSRNVYL